MRRQLTGTNPLLSDTEIMAIATQARAAATHEGHPLDLEWAIDQDGTLVLVAGPAHHHAAGQSQRV